MFTGRVKDCNDNEYLVIEPKALALYPMNKTLNDTRSAQNLYNMEAAQKNNPNVNFEPIVLFWGSGRTPEILRVGEIK